MKALLIAFALVACGDNRATTTTTTTTPPQAPPTASKADGLVAFEAMRGVFQHARCQNCHPAGDQPLQGDDGHPHMQNVQRGPEGRGKVGEQCTTCHGAANPPPTYGTHIPPGAATGWRMPPPENKMVFVGATPHALCEQIKNPATNGNRDLAALRHHLDDPLVTWGWHPGNGRAAIPLPREQFEQAFATWSAAGGPCPE